MTVSSESRTFRLYADSLLGRQHQYARQRQVRWQIVGLRNRHSENERAVLPSDGSADRTKQIVACYAIGNREDFLQEVMEWEAPPVIQ
jgi:hypothetical protein